jgi:hypothetical protein
MVMVLPPTASARLQQVSSATGDVQIWTEDDGVRIALPLPGYQIEEVTRQNDVFQRVVVDDQGWALDGLPGLPPLPARGLLVAIPPTGAVTLEILDARADTLPGRYRVEPAPQAMLGKASANQDAAPAVLWQADDEIYAEEAWLPSDAARMVEEGWLRGQRFVRLSLHPFQYNPAAQALRAIPLLQVRLHFAELEPLDGAQEAVDPLFDPILESVLVNYGQATRWRARPAPTTLPAMARKISHLDGPWLKITVDEDGLYRISYQDLLDGGISSSTIASLDPATLRLFDQDQELPIAVPGAEDGHFDPEDNLHFYGLRNRQALSSDENVYWLTWGGSAGLRMVTRSAPPDAAPPADTLLVTTHVEENNQFVAQRPHVAWLAPVIYDHWYWEHVESAKTISLQNLKVDLTSTVSPRLSVWLAGNLKSPGDYTLNLDLNGQPAGQKTWTAQRVLTGTVTMPADLLVGGTNDLRLTPGADPNTFWLDWMELTYPYNGEYLANTPFSNPQPGTWRYEVTGVPEAQAWVLNVGNPSQPELMQDVMVVQDSGGSTLAWQLTTSPQDRFLIVPPGQVRSPVEADLYVDAGLLDPNQQVDYLMISHGSLISSLQPLASHHRAVNDLSVRIVDVQSIYDLFSDGSVSAKAIHDYLAYAYSSYQWPAPGVVLLVGDGTVDFRGYQFDLYGHANLMPPYMGGFDEWTGASNSDVAYVLLQGDDVLGEMVVSRLPVNNGGEATVVVNKILNYADTFPADRALSTLWVSDNPDNDNPILGTQFYMATEQTLGAMQPDFQPNRIYYCNPAVNSCPADPWYLTDVPTTRSAIVDAINQGHLLLHFAGHGSYTTWAHELLFRSYWVDQLDNGSALPFLLVSSCDNGFFASPRYDGLDEVLLRSTGKGTIGGFTGATYDLLDPQTVVVKSFVQAVMQEGISQVGLAGAVARAQAYAGHPQGQRAALGHALSGDPLLALLQPAPCAQGDLNCDDDLDIVDVQAVAAAWGTVAWDPGYNPRADLVQDGRIDVADILKAAALWQLSLP